MHMGLWNLRNRMCILKAACLAKAGAGGLEIGRPVAQNCGPYKKRVDKICSRGSQGAHMS